MQCHHLVSVSSSLTEATLLLSQVLLSLYKLLQVHLYNLARGLVSCRDHRNASEIIQSSSIYAPVLPFRDWHHHTSPGNHGIMSFLHDQLNRTHQKSTKTSLNLLKPVSPSLPGAVLCFRLPSACLTSSIVKSSVSSKFWFSQHSSPLTKLPSHFFTLVQNTLKVGLAHHQCFLPHFH